MSKIIKLIGEGKPVFLFYDFEDAYVKIDNGYFLKFEGRDEVKVSHDHKLVNDAILDGNMITEKEYINESVNNTL